MTNRTLTIRFWTIAGLLLLSTAAVAFVVGPAVISRAYRGDGFGFLGTVLAGREEHPQEDYLTAWSTAARLALIAELAFAAGLYVCLLFRERVGSVLEKLIGGEPDISAFEALLIAGWLGALSGFVEVWHLGVRQLIERLPASGFAWEYLWMGPISSALAFLLVGGLLIPLVAALRRLFAIGPGIGLRFAVFSFAWLAVFAPLQTRGVPLAMYAVLVLTLGAAVAITRAMAHRPQGSLRLVRRTSVAFAAVVAVGTVVGLMNLPSRLEQRRLGNLGPAPAGGPNVVLIILDTVRAISMSLYGYEKPTTPNIDRLTDSGVVFDRAVAPSPWTLPSHASIFTGRHFHELSVDRGTPLDAAYPTLAEVLGDAGYATAGFVANYFNTTDLSGLNRGFARWEDYPMTWGRLLVSSWLASQVFGGLLPLEAHPWRVGEKTARANTDDIIQWLSEHDGRPFFAFVNYMDAHAPYDSPAEFRARFPADRPVVNSEFQGASEEALSGTRARYDAALAYLDNELGRLLDELERRDGLENTIVIVASDHGEQFGEHGLQYHGNSLYAPVVHVPLTLVYPPVIPSGLHVSQPVSVRDIAATVMELTLGRTAEPLSGSSLSRYWHTPEAEVPPLPVLTEVTDTDEGPVILEWEPVFRGSMRSIFFEDYHYILNGDGSSETYDLRADPDELVDLSGNPQAAPIVQSLAAALDSIITATGAADDRWPDTESDQAPPSSP